MYFSGGRLDTAPQCMKVTIGKGNINPTVSIDGWTYGEEPKAPTVTGNTGNGAVTYEYKAQGADDSTYATTVPTTPGTYTVRATIADSTTHYGGITPAVDFTIAKATTPDQDVRVVGVMSTNDTTQAWETSVRQSLAGMMPANAGALSYQKGGAPKYKVGESVQDLPEGFTLNYEVNSTSGVVNATLQVTQEAAEAIEQVGEIILPVKVTSAHYNDATINVVLMPTARTEMTVAISGVPETVTYGGADFMLTATVTNKETGAVVSTDNGDWYWYSSDPGVLEVPEVKDGYKASSAMPVKVKGSGSATIMAWYEPSDSAQPYIGAAVTGSITVNKAKITPSVSLADWTYGSKPSTPVVNGNPGNGTPTYEYKAAGAADSTYTAAVPTLAGGYTVRATVPETANYKGANCTADFAIAKKRITATVTALDKTYDGTTDATAIATVEKSDLVESDIDSSALVEDGKVAISGVTCTFENKNAGENKAVFFKYDNVTSPVANAECYEVTIAATPAAAITPRAVNVGAADKSSSYGQAIAELTYGLYGSNGLVEGDTLETLGVTASTKATSTSNVGYYPIKLSGGTSNGNYKVTFGGDATYTITKVDPVVTAPAATNPTYSGSPQALVTAGTVEGGEIQYSLDGKTFSANMPVGTDAGEYAVWYKVVGDANHNDTEAQQLASTIAKATVPPQAVRVVERAQSVDSPSAHWEASFEQSLAGMMPGGTGALTYKAGTPRYKNGETTLPDGVTSFTSGVDSNGMVTAKLEIPSSAEGIPANAQEITVPVTVKSEKNYEDAVINVVMVPTRKQEMTVNISGVPDDRIKTFGDGPFILTATVTDADGKEVETNDGDWYWYSSDPNVLEVASLQGSNEMSVTVKKPGSAQIMAWYEPSGSNTIGAAVTDSITVDKAAIEPSVTLEGWTYGGGAKTPKLTDGSNPGGGAVAYSYSGTTAGGTAFGPSTTPPTQAGNYTVTATVSETANYKGATCTAGFTIAKKEITATVTAEDKTYDGTTDATVSATVDANDLAPSDLDKDTVEGGKVTISGLRGTFENASVGADKAVALDYDGAVSSIVDPANYDVTIPSVSIEATITPRPVSVRADDKSSRYGQDIVPLTYSLYDSTELAKGDTLDSLGIDASTTATKGSAVGEYPITLTGGEGNPNYKVTLDEDATYTITKADSAVTAPAATNPTYSGEAQELVTVGSAEGGTMEYSLDGKTFTEGIPTGTDAGEYAVWYRVVGDGNHADAEPQQVAAAIAPADISQAEVTLAQTSYDHDGKAKEPAVTSVVLDGKTLAEGTDYDVSYAGNVEAGTATVTVTGKGNYAGTASAQFTIANPKPITIDPDPEYHAVSGGGSDWYKGSADGLAFTFKRSANDAATFSHFTGIRVDGADVAKGDYDAVAGSVVVTLKPAFLEALAAGEHTIVALFDDAGPAEAKFTVEAAAAPTPGGNGNAADKGNAAATPAAAAKATQAAASTAAAKGSAPAKTGDALPPAVPIAIGVVAVAAVVAIALALRARRRSR